MVEFKGLCVAFVSNAPGSLNPAALASTATLIVTTPYA